jgi:hypothetical protein
MLKEVMFQVIGGLPLGVWGGLVGLVILLSTAIVGGMAMKGKAKLSIHKILAGFTILISLIHGFGFLLAFLLK